MAAILGRLCVRKVSPARSATQQLPPQVPQLQCNGCSQISAASWPGSSRSRSVPHSSSAASLMDVTSARGHCSRSRFAQRASHCTSTRLSASRFISNTVHAYSFAEAISAVHRLPVRAPPQPIRYWPGAAGTCSSSLKTTGNSLLGTATKSKPVVNDVAHPSMTSVRRLRSR